MVSTIERTVCMDCDNNYCVFIIGMVAWYLYSPWMAAVVRMDLNTALGTLFPFLLDACCNFEVGDQSTFGCMDGL